MALDEDVMLQIFHEEREALGLPYVEAIFLDPPPLDYYESFEHWRVMFDFYSTGAYVNKDGIYAVQFNPLSCKDERGFRRASRHELYHIYKGHVSEEASGLFRYLFVNEPQALMYEWLGIRR